MVEKILEQRTFYKPVIRSGLQYSIFLPKDIVTGLGIEDRDELEFIVRKTGRKIPPKRPDVMKPFGRRPKQIPKSDVIEDNPPEVPIVK